jgi:probable selenium-dependent hydroxylase accessory protein YqeC
MRFLILTEAIGLRANDILACVGAGGKTSTCRRLWTETQTSDRFAIYTTTTHILEAILPRRSALLLSADPDPACIRSLSTQIAGLILASCRLSEAVKDYVPNPIAPVLPAKLKGLSSERIDRLINELPDVTWLVEADGARGRGLKVPDAHEPAIPGRATIVVVLIHMDSIGQPLDDAIAHRPDRVADFLGTAVGTLVSPEHITRLLIDPAGGLKNTPRGSRVVAVLNQRSEAQPHPQARSVARTVLVSGRYERVISASLYAKHPVLEVFTS